LTSAQVANSSPSYCVLTNPDHSKSGPSHSSSCRLLLW
jgi:hypothetical protein